MKLDAEVTRKVYEGTYNYGFASKPASKVHVEVLGDVVGKLQVFQIWIANKDQGYFVGHAPKGNCNFYKEHALDLNEQLGVDASKYSSDAAIVGAVNNILCSFVDDVSWFNYLSIDPLEATWAVDVSASLHINAPWDWAFSLSTPLWDSSVLPTAKFVPSTKLVLNMMKTGELETSKLAVNRKTLKEAKLLMDRL